MAEGPDRSNYRLLLLVGDYPIRQLVLYGKDFDLLPTAIFESCKYYSPSIFALQLTHLDMLVTGKFTRIWVSHF
jgi:hypothetical protein